MSVALRVLCLDSTCILSESHWLIPWLSSGSRNPVPSSPRATVIELAILTRPNPESLLGVKSGVGGVKMSAQFATVGNADMKFL